MKLNQVQGFLFNSEQSTLYSLTHYLSIFNTHHIVKKRIESWWEIVETAREIKQNLINCSEHLEVFEVDVAKPLNMEGGPGDKEQNDDGNWNKRVQIDRM